MALQRITPGLRTTTLVTGKTKFSSDIDLSFAAKPGVPTSYDSDRVGQDFKGDIYKKTDVSAILQSVENILLTNTQEKPFEPSFGGNLRGILFENASTISEPFMINLIEDELKRWEPRVTVRGVTFFDGGNAISRGSSAITTTERNELSIRLELLVNNQGFEEEITTTILLNRLR